MPVPVKKSESFPKTAKERVFSEMREWIIDGTLKPGEKIFDKEIAEYFAVSRTPVREAFQMLEEQKLITVEPGRESRVAEIDPDSIRQSYEILASLESVAVRYAVGHETESDITDLRNSVDHLKKAIQAGDVRTANESDHRFHERILKMSGNDFLLRFCSILETHIARTEIFFFSKQDVSEVLPASVKEHEEIIEAILAKDAETASQRMADNWLNTIPCIEKYLSTLKNDPAELMQK